MPRRFSLIVFTIKNSGVCCPSNNGENKSTPEGWAKSGNAESRSERCREPEHKCVNDQRKKTKG